ncbi:MAG: DUF296 domain-containing protein [Candidatus Kerfeldbacteria bacterium]|nr:DUF296 domain-containing protein [Candidatus Kerfeldbacteria bacterium]
MHYSLSNNTYLLRLLPGEELIESLTQFCKDHAITGGSITGLGGTTNATLHYFNSQTKQYQERYCTGQFFEVVNITGNISVEKLHIHVTIGDHTFQAWAGHCGQLVADPTLEIFMTPFPETHRRFDDASGLQLLDLPQK